jgi:hypothetical protein
MSDIGMEAYVDIGTLPILEWKDLVWHFLFQYWNKRCRCRMSDIADIKADVDAHLCCSEQFFSLQRSIINVLFKGTVSPNTGLHFSFWKNKLVLSAGLLMVLTFFYFVVPEIFENWYLNCFYENTYVQTLLKAGPESLFRLTNFAVRALAGFFSKLLVYCESGFWKPVRKSTGGFQ